MEVDLCFAAPTRRPTRPDFATLVAVTVARQSASLTARMVAGGEGVRAAIPTPVDLFGTARLRRPSACFNSEVAALLTARKRT